MGIFKPERTVPVPTKDILSWMFDDPHFDRDEPVCLEILKPNETDFAIATDGSQIYIDAKDTSRFLSSNQARVIIRKLVAGFQAVGLKKGDCVCIHSFNDVRFHFRLFTICLIVPIDILSHTSPGIYCCWWDIHRSQSGLYQTGARPSYQDIESDILDFRARNI
jgi:hypothetical protein